MAVIVRTASLISVGAVAAQLLKVAVKWFLTSRGRKYGGLAGVVSFSSRLIAASRAVETEQQDAFIRDPLAAILAGPEALARRKAYDVSAIQETGKDQQQQQLPQEAATTSSPESASAATQSHESSIAQHGVKQRPVPRIIMRTRFMDDATLVGVGAGPSAEAQGAFGPCLRHIQTAAAPACKQVVLLGSGMDTRPWRLPLPPGISWFEVDQQDVLSAKRKELAAAEVQLQGSSSTKQQQQEQQQKKHEEYAYPLHAGSWATVAADLQKPGWTQQLVQQGFSSDVPTMWVAEGLLYYLEPSTVTPLLQEVASISAPGSLMAVNFLTESGLNRMQHRQQHQHKQDEEKGHDPPPKQQQETKGSPPQGQQAELLEKQEQQGGAPGGSKDQGPEVIQSAAGPRTKSKETKVADLGLTSKFQWGCPDNVEQYFHGCQWQVLQRHSWTQAAAAYSWTPEPSARSIPVPKEHEVQFMVAAVVK